jgi:hypothetical protein
MNNQIFRCANAKFLALFQLPLERSLCASNFEVKCPQGHVKPHSVACPDKYNTALPGEFGSVIDPRRESRIQNLDDFLVELKQGHHRGIRVLGKAGLAPSLQGDASNYTIRASRL